MLSVIDCTLRRNSGRCSRMLTWSNVLVNQDSAGVESDSRTDIPVSEVESIQLHSMDL